MKLLSPAISSLARMRCWRIDAWKNNPINAQREVLQDLVTSAQYTEFGKKYNFSNLYTIRAFKAAVPIHENPGDAAVPASLVDPSRRPLAFEKTSKNML